MAEIVYFARCPEHGLHGCRTRCFECGEEAEQVPMVALVFYEQLRDALQRIIHHVPVGERSLAVCEIVAVAATALHDAGEAPVPAD